MDIFHGRNEAMDLIDLDGPRKKTYKAIEHLNAAVNILRDLGRYDIADHVKNGIRQLNGKVEEVTQ